MENTEEAIQRLKAEFADCQSLLIALGDENRQHMILEMMQMGKCEGARVGDITRCTHLSRPAVSHHLQILKAAGILSVRREGTKNYYFFDCDAKAFQKLICLLTDAQNILSANAEVSTETRKENEV